MKLIWKNKIFWKEEEYCFATGHNVEIWYIHPVIAIPSIIMTAPLTYLLCKWILW